MLKEHLDSLCWQDVPNQACRLAKSAVGTFVTLRELLPHLPDIGATVWYNPDKEKLSISYPVGTDSEKVASVYIACRQVPGVERIEQGYFHSPPANEPNILVKRALNNSSVFGPVASTMQLKPSWFSSLYGGPNPLAATLAGGLLGAGVGWGAGRLAEVVLPDKYVKKGPLSRTTAVLGGLMGAIPGAYWGFNNMRGHDDPVKRWSLSSWLSRYPYTDPPQPAPPELPPGEEHQASDRFAELKEHLQKSLPAEALELSEEWTKAADETGSDMTQNIAVDQFNRLVWNDLRSQGGFTDAPLAAATTGLVQAASLSQGGTNWISPYDVARIGVGMGSGYYSGLVVGRALGALAGLKPEAQQALQQGGMWAGFLGNVVPLAFR